MFIYTHLWFGHFQGSRWHLLAQGDGQLIRQHHDIANLLDDDPSQQIAETGHVHEVDGAHQIEVDVRIVQEEDLETAN